MLGRLVNHVTEPHVLFPCRWGAIVRASAALYLLIFIFIAVTPQSYPTTLQNFPDTPIVWLACTFAMLLMWYCPRWGGRHFYSGPVSASAGSLNFAITSQTLRRQTGGMRPASLCMCAFQDMVSQRAPRKDPRRSSIADSSTQSRGQSLAWEPASPRSSAVSVSRPAKQRRRLVLALRRWLAHAVAVGAGVWELLPSGSGIRMTLRIPGENEAGSRAQKNPIHPAGYAWDKEASKRLGHREVPAMKRSYGA